MSKCLGKVERGEVDEEVCNSPSVFIGSTLSVIYTRGRRFPLIFGLWSL